MRVDLRVLLLVVAAGLLHAPEPTGGQSATIAPREFRDRRQRALERLGRDVLLLRSRSSAAPKTESAFRQDPDFYYFTGLGSVLGAVLALDGGHGESWLFLPDSVPGFLGWVASQPAPSDSLSGTLLLDHVVPDRELDRWVADRVAGSDVTVLLDPGGLDAHLAGFLPSMPDSLPFENRFVLWDAAARRRWGAERVRADSSIVPGLRRMKSPAEVAVLREVASASAAALRAGLAAVGPGRRQRAVEGEIVSACLREGASGPSFWPWVMSGANSVYPRPWTAVLDYERLDREMEPGELVRLDVGCDLGHYAGDVGRTVPVSGRFDEGQREAWDLLVRAYRAGLAVIREGVRVADVKAAGLEAVRSVRDSLTTSLGRDAADAILAPGGDFFWYVHGLGLTTDEETGDVLRSGMVVAWEPMVSVGDQGFYLEDMILVTREGHELLTPGLPYTAREIERFTSGRE